MRIKCALILGLLVLQVAPLALGAEKYEIDPAHSSVVFRIKHNGVAPFYGSFGELSGSFTMDAEEPKNNSVELVVNAASVNTGNERRDGHLKSPDFLSAKEFPEITFKSTAVKKVSASKYKVMGNLTMHGVKNPLEIEVEHTGTGKSRDGGALIGMATEFTIQRSEFGVKYGLGGPLADDVHLMFGIEAAAAK